MMIKLTILGNFRFEKEYDKTLNNIPTESEDLPRIAWKQSYYLIKYAMI